jgi:hypothetical protein
VISVVGFWANILIQGKAVPLLALEAFEQAVLYISSTCSTKQVAKFLETSIETMVDGEENAPSIPDLEEERSTESSPGFKIHTKLIQVEVGGEEQKENGGRRGRWEKSRKKFSNFFLLARVMERDEYRIQRLAVQ